MFALKDPAGTKALLDVYQKMDTSSSLLKKESRSFFQKCRSIHSAAMFVVSEGIGYVPVPGVGEGFSAMTDLIGDPDLSARSNVVLLLAKNKGPQAQDILKSGLNDDDWSVRAATAQMIAHMAQVDLRESLVPLFEDKRIR